MKKKPAASPLSETYLRTDDHAARLEGVEFPPEVWAVFSLTEQPVHASTLAPRLKLPEETVTAILRRLVRRKLIRKLRISWQDYLTTGAGAPPPAATVAPTPAALPAPTPVTAVAPATPAVPVAPLALVTPAADTPPASAPAPVAVPTAPTILSFRVINQAASAERSNQHSSVIRCRLSPAPAASRPPFPFRTPAAAASSATPASTVTRVAPPSTTPPTGGWRLRPLLDAISAKAGGGLAGQILVYRVFLRVPTELMAAAGLTSLNLVEDHFRITDPRLHAAIIDSARTFAELQLDSVPA